MTDTTTAAHRGALVRALGVLGEGPEERLDRITRMAQEAFGVPLSFLNLVDEDTVHSQSSQGPFPQGTTAPARAVFCSTTIEHAEPTIVPDTILDRRFAELPVVIGEPHIRFYAGAPLAMVDGTRVGTLCLMDTAPRTIDDADVQLLRDLARWAERELSQSIDRERLRRVLDGLVPDPVDVPGYDLDSVSIAREEGGGDIVDWRRTADGDLLVTIGDVASSGPAAALLAAGLRGALLARTEHDLDAGMLGLEAQMEPELARAGVVASVFQARLTPRTGRVDFVDAGHGLALHVRSDGTGNVLRSLDLPIGLHPSGVARASGSLVLRPGDRLVLLTDGVLQLDGLGDLAAVGRAVVDAGDGDAFVDRVRSDVLARRPDADVTALVLSRA
jgi:hypothetical protein